MNLRTNRLTDRQVDWWTVSGTKSLSHAHTNTRRNSIIYPPPSTTPITSFFVYFSHIETFPERVENSRVISVNISACSCNYHFSNVHTNDSSSQVIIYNLNTIGSFLWNVCLLGKVGQTFINAITYIETLKWVDSDVIAVQLQNDTMSHLNTLSYSISYTWYSWAENEHKLVNWIKNPMNNKKKHSTVKRLTDNWSNI